ncbi:hypothetical protein LTS18_012734 [Coniosporium uncinatum]|uniref:Uncharacterized protein n=1 Tax=Coniosporium uncinatum TaxID=93489 RepID=A0ACC3DIU1_9PEZI|nr:hypothetical protein LTS18_012734 [Coniosporium uncinatum]
MADKMPSTSHLTGTGRVDAEKKKSVEQAPPTITPNETSTEADHTHQNGYRRFGNGITSSSAGTQIDIDKSNDFVNRKPVTDGAEEAEHATGSGSAMTVNNSLHDDLRSQEIANSSDDEMMFNSPTMQDMDEYVGMEVPAFSGSRDEDVLKVDPPRALEMPSENERTAAASAPPAEVPALVAMIDRIHNDDPVKLPSEHVEPSQLTQDKTPSSSSLPQGSHIPSSPPIAPSPEDKRLASLRSRIASQDFAVTHLQAKKTGLLAQLAAVPSITLGLPPNSTSDLASSSHASTSSTSSTSTKPGSTRAQNPRTNMPDEQQAHLLAEAKAIITQHIKLLHHYNEIRDVGQALMGLIAESRGVRIKEVQEDFGVGGKE